jgi:hypothetical protein
VERRRAEEIEEVIRVDGGEGDLGPPVAAQVVLAETNSGEAVEQPRLFAEILELQRRHLARLPSAHGLDADEALGIAIGGLGQQETADEAEDGGVGADAQGEDGHDDGGGGPRAPGPAQGVPQLGEDRFGSHELSDNRVMTQPGQRDTQDGRRRDQDPGEPGQHPACDGARRFFDEPELGARVVLGFGQGIAPEHARGEEGPRLAREGQAWSRPASFRKPSSAVRE